MKGEVSYVGWFGPRVKRSASKTRADPLRFESASAHLSLQQLCVVVFCFILFFIFYDTACFVRCITVRLISFRRTSFCLI